MSEIEILKQQVSALEKLVAIKDQTISVLQSRPYYYQPYYYQPYWYGNSQTTGQSSLLSGTNQYQQQGNQEMQQNGVLCAVSGGNGG